MSNYKLIQLGCALFGEGETVDECRENAKEWLDDDTDVDAVPVHQHTHHVRNQHFAGDLVIVPSDVADDLGDYS